ncbi:Hypothetical protein TPAR_09351 [Tolypocladium paradoxum]|uniref:Uncharacterized protein n=1 Tax=Tolypocladium paradoxum TaxID=94208 RepID=A0A2S4L896_9HYPO|nr:Hypothetical protein TPAR_09351 [Tolypocladium paradoxum]
MRRAPLNGVGVWGQPREALVSSVDQYVAGEKPTAPHSHPFNAHASEPESLRWNHPSATAPHTHHRGGARARRPGTLLPANKSAIYMIAVSAAADGHVGGQAYKALCATIVGPVFLTRTSILIPLPPQLYARMPVFLKRTLFLEFPMYVFDPAKHSHVKHPGGGAEEQGAREQANGDDRGSAEERL